MEYLNKENSLYLKNAVPGKGYGKFTADHFMISSKSSAEIGLKAGDLMTFVPDNDRLFFFIDNEDDRGFAVTKHHSSMHVANKPLMKTLLTLFPLIRKPTGFPIRRMVTKTNGKTTWEIMFDRSVTK